MKRSFGEWKQMVEDQVGRGMVSDIISSWEEERFRLGQDIQDMHASQCSAFVRCSECYRLHDEGWACPYCGCEDG